MAIERTEDPLLTVAETAERLRVHPITVRRYIASGRLAAVRAGRNVRVRESAVEAFIGGSQPGQPPSQDELKRRRFLVTKMRRLRDNQLPLGISTAELIRQGREELERR